MLYIPRKKEKKQMAQLNKILLNYLDQEQNKIVFADENGSYDLKTF